VTSGAGDFLVEWHRIVAQRDLDALRSVLAEEVVAPKMMQFLSERNR